MSTSTIKKLVHNNDIYNNEPINILLVKSSENNYIILRNYKYNTRNSVNYSDIILFINLELKLKLNINNIINGLALNIFIDNTTGNKYGILLIHAPNHLNDNYFNNNISPDIARLIINKFKKANTVTQIPIQTYGGKNIRYKVYNDGKKYYINYNNKKYYLKSTNTYKKGNKYYICIYNKEIEIYV